MERTTALLIGIRDFKPGKGTTTIGAVKQQYQELIDSSPLVVTDSGIVLKNRYGSISDLSCFKAPANRATGSIKWTVGEHTRPMQEEEEMKQRLHVQLIASCLAGPLLDMEDGRGMAPPIDNIETIAEVCADAVQHIMRIWRERGFDTRNA